MANCFGYYGSEPLSGCLIWVKENGTWPELPAEVAVGGPGRDWVRRLAR